jgi:hypothetical protein
MAVFPACMEDAARRSSSPGQRERAFGPPRSLGTIVLPAIPTRNETMLSDGQRNTSALLCFAFSALAASGTAQSLITTSANVIAADGMSAPGTSGATFGGPASLDLPSLDASGAVLFRGRLVGAGVTSTNNRALFHGASSAGLGLVIRGGDGAPTLPGVTLDTGTAQGIGPDVRLSANGLSFWGSALSGAGVVASNDSAIFGGAPGNLGVLVREGSLAPSGGSTYSSTFQAPSSQPTGINASGRILFKSMLSGGDVSGTTNDFAWISGVPGALAFVQREGDPVLANQVVGSLGFTSQLNAAGQVLHDATLSHTQGLPPATSADDYILSIWTPGIGDAVIVREGDAAPGTGGATFHAAFDIWSAGVGACSFNGNGEVMFQGALQGGTVTGPADDTGYFLGSAGGVELLVREGDAAPGTDGVFSSLHGTLQFLNDNGRIAFLSGIAGGSTSAADDSGLWAGLPGSLELVAREGEPAPGLPGELIGPFNGSFMMFNEQGQVYFATNPTGGTTATAYYGWTPSIGLTLVAKTGDSVEVSPGVFKLVQSVGTAQFNNGDSNPQGFGAGGTLALLLGFDDSTYAIVTVVLPSPAFQNYCDPGHNDATACPCGNPPVGLGRGCNNSSFTGGASIVASGVPSLLLDTLSMTTSSEQASATSILLSGTVRTNGVVFGQGIRCVAGSLRRLFVKQASGGSITAPGAGDPSISARHAQLSDPLAPGSRRFYTVYYRDPIVLGGCPATSTFNSTDAVDVTWGP